MRGLVESAGKLSQVASTNACRSALQCVRRILHVFIATLRQSIGNLAHEAFGVGMKTSDQTLNECPVLGEFR